MLVLSTAVSFMLPDFGSYGGGVAGYQAAFVGMIGLALLTAVTLKSKKL
jgi:hypothetical protein